jgi:peptidoglycan/LPS O-acetylase OafA/YrhL
MGWVGVQLFFVLSGFLITRILLRSRTAPAYFRTFFTRRALRILPLYYFMLVVVLGLIAHTHPPPELAASTHHQMWLWVFLANWAQPFGANVAGLTHFWSLAVEEQFYLVWPFAVLLISPRRLLWSSLGLSLAALLLRLYLNAQGASIEVLYQTTPCRMDALLLGAAVAIAVDDAPLRAWLTRRAKWCTPLAFFAFSSGALFTRGYERGVPISETIGHTFLAIAFALVILRFALPRPVPVLLKHIFETPPLRSLGKYSYAMYVFHFPLGKFAGERILTTVAGPGPYSVTVAMIYALAILGSAYAMAWVSYRLLEEPMLRLRDRTFSRPDPQPASLQSR